MKIGVLGAILGRVVQPQLKSTKPCLFVERAVIFQGQHAIWAQGLGLRV